METDLVVEIAHRQSRKVFSIEEAKSLVPILNKVTSKTATEVEELLKQLEGSDLENTLFIQNTEARVNQLIESWHEKVSKLGVKAKGLWYVDFDSGSDYFCWRYPEKDIFFKHSYQDGFTGRTLIDKSRPVPEDLEECLHDHNEDESVWAKNSSRTNKLTPWRL